MRRKPLEPSHDVLFLYKVCPELGFTNTLISMVPEYREAVLQNRDKIKNAEDLYRILSEIGRELSANSPNGYFCGIYRKILKQLSRDVRGDSEAWQHPDPQ